MLGEHRLSLTSGRTEKPGICRVPDTLFTQREEKAVCVCVCVCVCVSKKEATWPLSLLWLWNILRDVSPWWFSLYNLQGPDPAFRGKYVKDFYWKRIFLAQEDSCESKPMNNSLNQESRSCWVTRNLPILFFNLCRQKTYSCGVFRCWEAEGGGELAAPSFLPPHPCETHSPSCPPVSTRLRRSYCWWFGPVWKTLESGTLSIIEKYFYFEFTVQGNFRNENLEHKRNKHIS